MLRNGCDPNEAPCQLYFALEAKALQVLTDQSPSELQDIEQMVVALLQSFGQQEHEQPTKDDERAVRPVTC